MKQLFLTSSIHAVAHDIAKRLDLSVNNNLVFITTPIEPVTGDKTWVKNDRQALCDAGFKVTDYTITNKTIDQLKKDLSEYKYIYLSGGNTFYLLKQSQKSGFITLIKDLVNIEEKIYIGTSAGSIIAGPKCPDYLLSKEELVDGEKQKGYEFVNFTILPHWGTEHFKKRYLGERLEIAYEEDQVPLLLLTDSQYVHVQGDTSEIIDVTKRNE